MITSTKNHLRESLALKKEERKILTMKQIFAIALFIFLASSLAVAQDMNAVRRAVVSTSGEYLFNLDFTGQMQTDAKLEINTLQDSGTFTGYFLRNGETRPARPNITDGRISIVRTTGGANGISISFTVAGSRTLGSPLPVNTMTFDGAIRLTSTGRNAFMAGTYRSGAAGAGPFPFCAALVNIPQ